ncbi:2-desacetyl-2-hydroxyethyl bacteriochlorophyllide A dehydrogenase [Verrucomicrobium sp. GAS474]|uniref:zinc-dependent alcohol dehydrogenase n=1 Tax=Verrucomicrobium sp. GAS474 TaxID=1882831 RepID=UPI00087A2B5E|nr:zinc-binding alcohol dehydrogenase [Verrucomicrobium sp. GAS474]SDU05569.1 2-desacetyl-2-hydroxyethyl bacteriochlorophyllide A dehydrogenase [Verrucomicrobium sp. GAS474]
MQINQVVITGKREVSLQSLTLEEGNLAPNEVLIESERSFISAGTELAGYTATDADVYKEGAWCAYPWKSGYGNVGRVLDAGNGLSAWIGKRVYTNGPHASVFRYTLDPIYRIIASVPEGISLEDAVAARMAMVAMSGLDNAKPGYARWVVVIGLGMVGNLAAQFFRLTGAHVIGVDPSARRRQVAQDCGIPHVLSGTEEEVAAGVAELTGGKLAEVTVDAVGHSAVSLQALRLTAQGGEVVVLGSPRTEFAGNLTEVFRTAHIRWITIKGALEWYAPTESPLDHLYTQQKKLAAIYSWIADGRLRIAPLLTHLLPPQEIKAAYEGLLNQKEDYVGVVLKWK